MPMTDEAMSPLRRRMIEDVTIRMIASKTQQGYQRL
jgi:integrase/recombinase XerD